jgi:hypothetical protein
MSDMTLDELEELVTGKPAEPDEPVPEDRGQKTEDSQDAGAQRPDDGKAAEDKAYPEGAVIASRSGAYTIEYSELTKAREKENAAKLEAENAKAQVSALQAQLQEQQEALRALQAAKPEEKKEAATELPDFGDFSPEAIASGVKDFLAKQARSLDEKVAEKIAPIAQKSQADIYQQHLARIQAKHPDADEILDSKEFADWVKTQPEYRQRSIGLVLQSGTTTDVIALFDDFKANLKPSTPATADAIEKATQNALKAAQTKAPLSLSEIPDGHAAPLSTLEGINDLSPQAQLIAATKLTPDQLAVYLGN